MKVTSSSVSEVDDVVGVSGDHLHYFDLLAADLEVDHLVRPDLTQPDQTVTAHHPQTSRSWYGASAGLS